MKIIPMSAESSYRQALEKAETSYMFSKHPEEIQKLLKSVFRSGWMESKLNTFQILETLAGDDGNGKKQ